MRKLPLLLVLLCLPLTACKDQSEASAILPKLCKEFPDSEIYKVDKRILWVQTHVDGISADVANTMYKAACQQAAYNLGKIKINIQTELAVDDKQLLIVGFKHFWVVWSVKNGVDAQGVPLGYQVMNIEMLKNFFTAHLGRFPSPTEIQVVTLQDAENTPKGEPMNAQTLDVIARAKQQQMLQQIQAQLQSEGANQ